MKAKRIIAVFSASALSACLLASCSEAELMYLDFTKDIAQWNVLTGSGEMKIELNNDILADFINDVSDDSYSASDIPFEKLSIVYTASVDYDKSIYDIDLDITVDDNSTYDLCYYVDTEKVVFDKSIINSVRQFLDDYNISNDNVNFILDFMDEYLENYDSIEIPCEYSLTDFGFTDYGISKELIDPISDFLVTAFDGYETSSYELNGDNGIKAMFNYNNVVKAVSDLFEYYINNIDKISVAWNDFNLRLSAIMNNMYPGKYNNDEPLALLNIDDAKELQAQFNSLVNDNNFHPLKDLLMNSEYGFDIDKTSDTSYKCSSYMDLNYNGNDLADITAVETNNKSEYIEIKEYSSFVFTNENDHKFSTDFNIWLENNYPVNSAKISWNNGDRYCDISYIRGNNYSESGYSLYIIFDDYIYIPMRHFIEKLGYTVGWDDFNNKAYIVNDSEKFYPDIIMVGDNAFVRVRDLEKIGLKIDYKDNESETIKYTVLIDKAA